MPLLAREICGVAVCTKPSKGSKLVDLVVLNVLDAFTRIQVELSLPAAFGLITFPNTSMKG
ncbi:MAG: hypothetical protein ACJAQW_000743 [Paracoccaceae bacterium]